MAVIRKDLGTVTAYAYAVSKGYTGTEAEFAELMASYAEVAEEAAQSASDAENAAERAEQAAATLTVDTALSDSSTNPVQNRVITGELTNVKSQLTNATEESPIDFFARDIFNLFPTGTNHSVTFTKGEGIVTANGTATDDAAIRGFIIPSQLKPAWVVPGETLRVKVTTSDTNLRFCVAFYDSNAERIGGVSYLISDRNLTVPNNTAAVSMYLNVPENATVTSATIAIKIYRSIYDLQSLDEIREDVPMNSKLYSIGNSILTGSVWLNGLYNHLSAYENAPYARIAKALGIKKPDVSHTVKSSTGLLYDAGKGNFLTTIKSADLTAYDYVLTHLWWMDLSSATSTGIGNISSTADDGTVAGAVISLANYCSANSSQLILIGIPPTGENGSDWGTDVFNHEYARGTIKETDELMHVLADKYHFVFVDWESLDISYKWKSYTDDNNVHLNNENTYRIVGDYLGRQICGQDYLTRFVDFKEDTDYKINRLAYPATVDGYVFIDPSDWEIGGIGYSDHVMTYGTNNKRIRTKQGFGYTIHAGDVIGLSDYTELCMLILIKKEADGIIYTAGVRTQDYVVPAGSDGIAYILVYKQNSETVIENVFGYLSKFFIRRVNSIISDSDFTTNVGRQFAINHQFGTPITVDDPETKNIIVCGKNLFRTPHGWTNHTSRGVTKTFNETAGTIVVSSEGATGATVAPEIYDNVNGVSWSCMYKFKLKSAANVVITANADKDLYVYGDIYIQLYDGVKISSIYNEPMVFKAAANTEYGLRIYTSSNYAGTVTLKPQIEIGVTYPTEFEPFKGVIVDENGDSICINTASESLDDGVLIDGYRATVISYDDDVTVNYDKVTDYDHGFMLYNLRNKKPDYRQPMLSIIDDDTVNTTYVKDFHDAMEGLGIVGNYAAMTKRLTDSNELKEMLLDYETEGFGVLLHCYYQYNEDTDYFRPGPNYRDIDSVRENMIKGLREIKGFGFISGNYWATPYGVNDDEIKALAKSLGIKAVISGMNDTPNLYNVTDSYSIGRYALPASSYTENVPVIKRGMDACISNGGWVIVTTHAYSWGDATADVLNALSEIVTYANTIGMKVVNFQEGYETYFGS